MSFREYSYLFSRNAYTGLDPSGRERIVMIDISEREICSSTKIPGKDSMVRPGEKMDPSYRVSLHAPVCLSPAFPPRAMGLGNAELSMERLATWTA